MKPIPDELWALRRLGGGLVPPMDDDGTDVIMAWPSKDEAERGLKHQRDRWGFDDLELTVVRIK